MTSLKAPNNANAEALDFDNQILEQIRDPASLNAATVTVLRAAEPCNKKISLNDTTGALEKIPRQPLRGMVIQKHPTHKSTSGFTLIELTTLSTYIAAGIHGECC